ncbi:DUF2235 domain-containing protein [Bradyrhizobium genosp. L]|uniref:DUF2235 domain-containing protein n=1 Tax=Bradyrhizobium genosp. L TaxID=83637 RepID=UPI0018A2FD87|nr:DUF2235 domain-containing protein [Bradyrhizobium genosp. L]QPF82698.1 DUF2235 domain-containing protein [Bradyrhizobium genosp. L]
MPKNIVLLSDGTGNSSAKIFKTNVWRLFQALDLRDAAKQVAFYDDGVGTSSFKWWAAITGIFGIGLKRNILDIYCFCSRNYRPGDRIFGFGFSRGSFTMRVVAGFIATIGLAPYNGSEADLRAWAIVAYREYRRMGTAKTMARFHLHVLRAIRDFFSHALMGKPRYQDIEQQFVAVDRIEFLGVWDTVDAYGGPIDEIVRAIDYWYWPLSLPDRFMNRKIQRACQALAIEEERDAFKPVLWDERYVKAPAKDGAPHRQLVPMMDGWAPPRVENGRLAPIDEERVSQVWFVGVHSDVGGGYPQDGLSYFTLDWMIARARVYGLLLCDAQTAQYAPLANRFDKLNDSRRGFGSYYRYKPRKLADIYSLAPYRLSVKGDWRHIKQLFNNEPDTEHDVKRQLVDENAEVLPRPDPKIHQGVFDRIDHGTDGYVPIVIPGDYGVTDKSGAIRSHVRETPDQAQRRANRQEEVFDLVWKRRVAYFANMFGLLVLFCMPLLQRWCPGLGAGSPFAFLIPAVDVVANYLPGLLKPWLDAFREGPERLFAGLVFVGLLTIYGTAMQGRIRDRMRSIWRTPDTQAAAPPDSRIYRLRSAGPYKAMYYVLTHWTLPSVFALVILGMLLVLVWYTASAVSRVSFVAYDATGHVCAAGKAPAEVTKDPQHAAFATSALCTATGMKVTKGQTYDVTLTVNEPWEDVGPDPQQKGIATGPNGFGSDKANWLMTSGLPYRRLVASNWLATVIRIGGSGFGEMVLPFESVDCQCTGAPTHYKTSFTAKQSGEVFVYVNDAIINWIGLDYFYKNNKGTADMTIALKPN